MESYFNTPKSADVNVRRLVKDLLKAEKGEKLSRQINQETEGLDKTAVIEYLKGRFKGSSVLKKYGLEDKLT